LLTVRIERMQIGMAALAKKLHVHAALRGWRATALVIAWRAATKRNPTRKIEAAIGERTFVAQEAGAFSP